MAFLNERMKQEIFEALGEASACWSKLDGAGVFNSGKCKEIGENLCKKIEEHIKKHLPEWPDFLEKAKETAGDLNSGEYAMVKHLYESIYEED